MFSFGRKPSAPSPAPVARPAQPGPRPSAQAKAVAPGARAPVSNPASPRMPAAPAPALRVVEEVKDSASESAAPAFVNSRPADGPSTAGLPELTKKLGRAWYGWLGGLVAATKQSELAVLNLGCGDVAIVGVESELHSSHAKSIREQIENQWNFKVVLELTVTAREAQSLSTRLSQIPPLEFDDRHLAVYDDWVRQAVAAKASDMHFSTHDQTGTGYIKLRIHGRIKKWRTCSSKLMVDSISAAFGKRTKTASATKSSFSDSVPVAFMTHQTIGGIQWEGRFNGRPHSRGYAGVMRVLDSEPRLDRIPTLPQLGYTESQIALIQPAVLTNYGLIVIFGSTGSGKSTSLRTFLTKVMNPEEVQIYTVENPVEYPMGDVVQFSLPVDVTKSSAEISQSFTAVLRDTMRMDPDVCMVAEVRDMETARLVSELTQTEHRCFTTCHGSGAVDGLSRLCGDELRLSSSTLAGPKFLSASIYQRLVPLLCPKCKVRATDPERGLSPFKQKVLREKFKLDAGTMFVANESGCEHCKPRVHGLAANGTLGVTVVSEIMIPTREIRAAILNQDWPLVESLWRSQRRSGFGDPDMRGKTAFEAALFKVSQGEVSILSVEKDFEPIEVYQVFDPKSEVKVQVGVPV